MGHTWGSEPSGLCYHAPDQWWRAPCKLHRLQMTAVKPVSACRGVDAMGAECCNRLWAEIPFSTTPCPLRTSRTELYGVLVTRVSTRQHNKILISGTIGAFRSGRRIAESHSPPPPPTHSPEPPLPLPTYSLPQNRTPTYQGLTWTGSTRRAYKAQSTRHWLYCTLTQSTPQKHPLNLLALLTACAQTNSILSTNHLPATAPPRSGRRRPRRACPRRSWTRTRSPMCCSAPP